MNPELPQLSREELEVRLTALLLGELPAAEAGAMLQLVASDAELGQLLARLEQTIGLVRQATQVPAGDAATPTTPVKLPTAQREQLLKQLRMPTPAQMGVPRLAPARQRFRWWMPVATLAVVLPLLAALLLPNFRTASRSARLFSVSQGIPEDAAVFKLSREALTPPPVAAPSDGSELRHGAVVAGAVESSKSLFNQLDAVATGVSSLSTSARQAQPAQDVYLPTEPAPEPAPQSAEGGVLSANVVGYVNKALPPAPAAGGAAGSYAWFGKTAGETGGGRGGGGFGGGGGGAGPQPQSKLFADGQGVANPTLEPSVGGRSSTTPTIRLQSGARGTRPSGGSQAGLDISGGATPAGGPASGATTFGVDAATGPAIDPGTGLPAGNTGVDPNTGLPTRTLRENLAVVDPATGLPLRRGGRAEQRAEHEGENVALGLQNLGELSSRTGREDAVLEVARKRVDRFGIAEPAKPAGRGEIQAQVPNSLGWQFQIREKAVADNETLALDKAAPANRGEETTTLNRGFASRLGEGTASSARGAESLGRSPARPALTDEFGGLGGIGGARGRVAGDNSYKVSNTDGLAAGSYFGFTEGKQKTGSLEGALRDAEVEWSVPKAQPTTESAPQLTAGLRLPMPTLKGTPEDLAAGANIENLGDTVAQQKANWDALQRSAAAATPAPPAAPPVTAPEVTERYRRRYGMAPAGPAAGNVASTDRKAGAPMLGDVPLVGELFKAKAAEKDGDAASTPFHAAATSDVGGARYLLSTATTNSVATDRNDLFDAQLANNTWSDNGRGVQQNVGRESAPRGGAILLPDLNGKLADEPQTVAQAGDAVTLNFSFAQTRANQPVAAGGAVAGERQLGEVQPQLALAREAKAPAQSADYEAKNREVERLRGLYEGEVRTLQTLDVGKNISAESMNILERAQPDTAQPPSLWARTKAALGTGEAERSARLITSLKLAIPEGSVASDEIHDYLGTTAARIKSDTVLQRAAKKLNLDEASTQALAKKVDVTLQPKTTIFDVRVKDADPARAAQIANAIAEEYIAVKKEMRSSASDSTLAGRTEKLLQMNRELKHAEEELEALQKQTAVEQKEAGGTGPTQMLENRSVQRLEELRTDADRFLTGKKQLLSELANKTPAQLRAALPTALGQPDALLNELLAQVSLTEQVLAKKQKDYGPENADATRVKAQVEDLNKKVDERVRNLLTNLQATVAAAQATSDQLAAAVAEARKKTSGVEVEPPPPPKPPPGAPVPQPEIATLENAFSTFSLNVADVSFKLAQASLEKGQMPDAAAIRSEEFINALDYRDPEPPPGAPVGFAWERARFPFAHNRDALRFSVKTAAAGRQGDRPLNLVLLLDNSGSMERADRVNIIRESLRVLASQLRPQDRISVVTFARTPRLWVDALPGNQAGELAERVGTLTPQGGTDLGAALDLAYQTALQHYLPGGMNRVVVLTDGAANLGDVDPDSLKQKVESHRKQGVALDCFGIGWEGYNDDLLEMLTRNGDGRYGFVNTPEAATTEFAAQLAGALQVAASDVKVQVEFNPARVSNWRQIGYAKHQLTKQQFRDNTVDAAEIAAAEAGNGLYVIEVNPAGQGDIATVRVRYKVPGTTDYRELEWPVPYNGMAVALEQASPAMRLMVASAEFSEWLASSPFSGEVSPDRLLGLLAGVPEVFGADQRPKKLEWMIRQAKSVSGK